MSSAAQEIEDLPEGGVLYEPRSLWDVFPVELLEGREQLVHLDREKFFNGTRYPITLDRVALAGIDYAYSQNVGAPPGFAWQSALSVVQGMRITVMAPFRHHYGRNPIRLNTLCPVPTAQPQAPLVPGSTMRSSSLWGINVLNFNKPFFLPRLGSIHWDMSSGYAPDAAQNVPVDSEITMLYEESGGLFAGNARTHTFTARELSSEQADFPNNGILDSQDSWPYSLDGYGGLATSPGNTQDFWQTDGAFNTKLFDEQEATRSGSSLITGLRVHINQIPQDDTLAVSPNSGKGAAAQMSTRLGTRIRTTNGGSKEFWWREGAPLCLVFDTVTPATVYKLPYPITLGPGDTLDVELVVPPLPAGVVGGTALQHQVNTGISFNGWAAIED